MDVDLVRRTMPSLRTLLVIIHSPALLIRFYFSTAYEWRLWGETNGDTGRTSKTHQAAIGKCTVAVQLCTVPGAAVCAKRVEKWEALSGRSGDLKTKNEQKFSLLPLSPSTKEARSSFITVNRSQVPSWIGHSPMTICHNQPYVRNNSNSSRETETIHIYRILQQLIWFEYNQRNWTTV
jgi:hypothetical protein